VDRVEFLRGHWVHSHEEDTADEMVFRRPDRPLPPSRGRASIELATDGSYRESSPGPVDVPEEHTGSWTLDGDTLVLGGDPQHPRHAWEIAAVDPQRLVVRK
jgi:hypothetical protein